MVQKKIEPGRWPQDLLVRLKEASERDGYVSAAAMQELAAKNRLPENDVFGVASFYSFLAVKPRGRHVIRLCKSLLCHMESAGAVLGAIRQALGISPGETTADGRFSLELTSCIGLCDRPPAMLVDDDPHVELTPEKIPQILEKYR